MKRCALFATIITWLLLPMAVLAHDDIVVSDPPAGGSLAPGQTEISITFTGPPGEGSGLTLLGPNFEQIPLEARIEGDRLIGTLPALAGGEYVVQWLVISVDGHALNGSYVIQTSGESAMFAILASESTAFNPPDIAGWIMIALALGSALAMWLWMRQQQ